MILDIYKKALSVLRKRPFRLWGVSLLSMLLASVAGIGFFGVPAVAFAIELALGAGMSMIYLNSYRTGLQPRASYLFSAFDKSRIVRVVGGMAWMYLWVFLWSLIPIVGIVFGIIRTYEYRFTPYILMTRDDVKATEAIQLSKQQTMGYKGKMFGADILAALAVILAILILALFAQIPYIGIIFGILYVLLSICWGLLSPLFYGIVAAAFYVEAHSAPSAPAAAPAPAPAPVSTPAPAPDTISAPAPEAVPDSSPEQPSTEAETEASPAGTATDESAPESEAPSTPPRPAFCTSCGAPVQLDEKFCTRCGHKL